MENVNTWWGKTSADMKEGTKVIAADIEDATQESMNWLDQNFDKLSDDTKRKYEEITMNLQRD